MNAPNVLTVLRIIITGVMLAFWFDPMGWYDGIMFEAFFIALLLFVVGSITDFLDGFLARKYNLVTAFGKIADPIADKFLTLSAFWCIIRHINSKLGLVFLGLIVLREVSVTVFRAFALKKGTVLAAGMPGKVKTAVQMVMIITCMLFIWSNEKFLNFTQPDTLSITASCNILIGISCFFTLYSGIYYFVKGFRQLAEQDKKEKKTAKK